MQVKPSKTLIREVQLYLTKHHGQLILYSINRKLNLGYYEYEDRNFDNSIQNEPMVRVELNHFNIPSPFCDSMVFYFNHDDFEE